ncbi:deuterolysin m35 metalloprotease [Moniliophthora roreri MCA 2997]|uniref:Deuterolysin m35 metalloprotease n=1 Tax=Moniliophthora roreri (strain MCA 2997) TaxID=1381753 RepID=V2X4I4_MONRO|nr:deuterolysin m35 metalloprotease [Moniliophthora roreri MCA 2997]
MSAITASASRGLSLTVSGPNSIDGVHSLKVVASLLNTGDETLKILKDPRGVLATHPTNTFDISNVQGAIPEFTGIKVKFVPEHAAQLEDTFTVLEPGQSVEVEHDLSAAYNFTHPGEGLYDIHANNLFQVVDPATNQLTDIYATHESAFKADVKGKLDIAHQEESGLAKSATYRSCSATQQSQIADAASSALTYAKEAKSYLKAHHSSTTRYTTWFGTYNSNRHSKVVKHFTAIKKYPFSESTYDCTGSNCKPGDFAWVSPKKYGVIHLCSAFWDASNTGTDSRAGTIVHEISHFTAVAGTDDIVYGQSGAKSLAKRNPKKAIHNADSHEYFAENIPALA